MIKKKIFGIVTILAIAAVTAFNVQINTSEENKLADFGLANVEALATPEGTPTGLTGGYKRDEKRIETGCTVSYGGSVSTDGASINGNVNVQYKTIVCCIPSEAYNACDWSCADSECSKY